MGRDLGLEEYDIYVNYIFLIFWILACFSFPGGRPWYYGMEQGRTHILHTALMPRPGITSVLWLWMHLKHFGVVQLWVVWATETPAPGTGISACWGTGQWGQAVELGCSQGRGHAVSGHAEHLCRRDRLKGDSREGPLQHCGSKTLLGDREMEVQIPPGRKGIEHGSATSWVTALITGLGDKKGMTAAVVNPTSYILEDIFSFCCKCLK